MQPCPQTKWPRVTEGAEKAPNVGRRPRAGDDKGAQPPYRADKRAERAMSARSSQERKSWKTGNWPRGRGKCIMEGEAHSSRSNLSYRGRSVNSLFRRGFDTAGKVIHRTSPLLSASNVCHSCLGSARGVRWKERLCETVTDKVCPFNSALPEMAIFNIQEVN